jgi:hypothetical protein
MYPKPECQIRSMIVVKTGIDILPMGLLYLFVVRVFVLINAVDVKVILQIHTINLRSRSNPERPQKESRRSFDTM